MSSGDRSTRRGFLQRAAGAGAVLLGSSGALRVEAAYGSREKNPYAPFTMGIQSYSLRHFPIAEMLQKVRDLGLRDLEGWDGHFPVTDDPAKIRSYRDALKAAGVRIHAYGAIGFSGDAGANRRTFTFARAMGIKTITADPSPDSFDSLDALVREFNINVAIHNHGPGSRYDKAEQVYDAIRRHDQRIGACIDTGHYLRSDVNPVDVARHLGPRVYAVHLKDVKTVDGNEEFTEIGKGDLDTVGLLRALRVARFKGLLALEYEEHEDDPMPYMRECLQATQAAIRKL